MATEQEGHTPGPWVADLHNERRDGGRFYVFITAKGQLVPICAVTSGVEGYGREEGRANARLIAAAPDLLKAGEGARQALWNALDHLGFECPDAHPAIVELDAAIARATGEA